MTSTILVLGATGMVGSHAARGLRERGATVRAFVRDAGRAATLLGPDIELAVGDLADAATLRRALVGVGRVLLCSANAPRQAELEIGAVDACAAAGVGRVVKISAKGAAVDSPVPFWAQHARIEDHLRRSGLPAVVLRPSTYASNLLAAAGSVAAAGRLFAPAGSAPIAFVDPRDVADVAVAALTADAPTGTIHTLTGPESLTFDEVAARWAAVLGRPVGYVDVPDEAALGSMVQSGLPEWLAAGIVAVFGQLRRGAAAATTDEVRAITGRPPRTVTEFLRDFAGAIAA